MTSNSSVASFLSSASSPDGNRNNNGGGVNDNNNDNATYVMRVLATSRLSDTCPCHVLGFLSVPTTRQLGVRKIFYYALRTSILSP